MNKAKFQERKNTVVQLDEKFSRKILQIQTKSSENRVRFKDRLG